MYSVCVSDAARHRHELALLCTYILHTSIISSQRPSARQPSELVKIRASPGWYRILPAHFSCIVNLEQTGLLLHLALFPLTQLVEAIFRHPKYLAELVIVQVHFQASRVISDLRVLAHRTH